METKTLILCVVTSAVVSSATTAFVLSLLERKQYETVQTQASPVITPNINQRLTDLENQLLGISSLDAKPMTEQPPRSQVPQRSQVPSEEVLAISQAASLASFEEQRLQLREQRRQRLQPDYRTQQFIEAGFAQEEAARIVQLEAQESLRQLDAQYQARRQQLEGQDVSLASSNPIRAELGDENYARYLEANGWPTSALVGSVIGGSPGANAGLQAGDSIVSYAGERVFNLADVNLLTAQGRVGQTVLIEVERNGEQVQLSIPRGPIGVSSGRRGFRR